MALLSLWNPCKFSIVSYQSEEGINWFGSCQWVHLLNSPCLWRQGCMPLVLKTCPKFWISLEKKWHLPNFMESFADSCFANTFLMCDRCSSTVLMNIIISSKYAIVKSKPFKILVINSWKYAGTWANLNGTLTYSYLQRGELNAVFGIED